MRVGHLIKSLGRGGAEALLPLQVRNAPAGSEFRAGYFLPWKDALVADLEAAKCPVRCFESRGRVSMIWKLGAVCDWIRHERIELLHCHLPLAGVIGRLAGRRTGVPVVYTEHNLLERYHPLTRRVNQATWKYQEEAIAVSEEVAESIRRNAGERVPVTVVHNGIDTTAFAPASDRRRAKTELGLPEDAHVVGTVAVFRVQKRLDRWLAVARRIADRHPGCRFLLVGAGPEQAAMERAAERLELTHSLVLPGLQTDVRPYLAAMDVFLIASDFEGLPLALLEAMAAGCPVVSTPVGGISEVLRDGAGCLAETEGQLADRIDELLTHPANAARMAARARNHVQDRFGITRMARDLDAIYRRILARSA